MLVSTLSHCTGHCEIEWLAGRNCGVAVVCSLKRGGIKCGSTTDKREAGVVDRPGEWAFSAYYQSAGRLAVLRRRFESAFRRPGLDPATFATELGILAIQGFEDMKEQARDTTSSSQVRDSVHCIGNWMVGEIVDSCRVWESHSESDRVFVVNCESDVGNQPDDSRTLERRKLVVNVQPKVAEKNRNR